MTELTQDVPGRHLFIRSIDEQGIRVGDQHFTRSLLISPEVLIDDWPPQSLAELGPGHFSAILELEPELVLLGTGAKQAFLRPEQLATFYRRQIGIELMSTEAACRTFNVLVGEGRKAVAALLPPQA